MNTPVAASEFFLHAANGLRLFNAALHGVLAVLLAYALWSRWPVALLLVLPLLVGHAVLRDRRFALRTRDAVHALRHDAEGWALATASGDWQPIPLSAGTTVTSLFIVLVWTVGRGRRQQLLLTPGMLQAGAYRQLCRLLWQAELPVTDGTQSV